MAFPYIFQALFEAGTNGDWDSETDTGSKLDFPHYSELARYPWSSCTPYRGAYCARIQMGDTNDHILIEGDIDIADAGTDYFRFYINIMPDVAATADDVFNIFELQQAGGTVESSVGLRITAATGAVEIGIGDGTAPSSYAGAVLVKNRWTCVELLATASTGGAGVLTLFIDGSQVVTLTSLTNAAAIGRGVLGTQDTLSTTTGTILLDDFTMDDARLFPYKERFPQVVQITKSTHVFIGPGSVNSAAILSANSDDQINVWDTDTANINDGQGFKMELDYDVSIAFAGPLSFQRGCYVQLIGSSNPRGEVITTSQSNQKGVVGPIYYSQNGLRWWGLNRTPHVET